jgi:hypothetical protein
VQVSAGECRWGQVSGKTPTEKRRDLPQSTQSPQTFHKVFFAVSAMRRYFLQTSHNIGKQIRQEGSNMKKVITTLLGAVV